MFLSTGNCPARDNFPHAVLPAFTKTTECRCERRSFYCLALNGSLATDPSLSPAGHRTGTGRRRCTSARWSSTPTTLARCATMAPFFRQASSRSKICNSTAPAVQQWHPPSSRLWHPLRFCATTTSSTLCSNGALLQVSFVSRDHSRHTDICTADDENTTRNRQAESFSDEKQ